MRLMSDTLWLCGGARNYGRILTEMANLGDHLLKLRLGHVGSIWMNNINHLIRG